MISISRAGFFGLALLSWALTQASLCGADQDAGSQSGAAGYGTTAYQGKHGGHHHQNAPGGQPQRPNRPLSDEEIKNNVLKAFSDEPDLSGLVIDAQVANGTATLSGTVPKQPQKIIADDAARNARGVRKLISKITLEAAPGTPKEKTDQPAKKTADTKQAKKCWWFFPC